MECIRCLDYHGPKEHFQFIAAAVLHHGAFLKLTRPEPGSAFAQLMADRPQYVSLLTAPYIDARWSSAERVDHLIDHASALHGHLGKYDFPVFQSLHLLDLGELGLENYSIVVDKPMWFCYEGLLTLNLFKGKFRFFSITFSFCHDSDGIGIVIGGIQGRKTADILAQYREFTKLAQGMRPRDFLLEVLRIVARAEGVTHILGIPDRFRYHRHSYFTRKNHQDLHLDYDEIWKDRGGVLTEDGMYAIPLSADRKLGRISSRKRSMYRRRYELLDRMNARVAAGLQTARPVISGPVD